MTTRARAVRFNDDEEKLIQHFLKLNSFMDFSTLARMAILRFVRNPKVQIIAVNNNLKAIPKHRQTGKNMALARSKSESSCYDDRK
jgi:hypothetical protein